MQKSIIALATLAASVLASECLADGVETYRLKASTTVDIVINGDVVGTKRLKAGTIVTAEAPQTADSKEKSGSRLVPSKITPVAFLHNPVSSAVFRSKVRFGTWYRGPFDGKEKAYWAIDVQAYNDGWSNSESLYAYISKSSPVGKKLGAILKDGKERPCLLKVKPVKFKDYDDEHDIVMVEDFEFLDVAKD